MIVFDDPDNFPHALESILGGFCTTTYYYVIPKAVIFFFAYLDIIYRHLLSLGGANR